MNSFATRLACWSDKTKAPLFFKWQVHVTRAMKFLRDALCSRWWAGMDGSGYRFFELEKCQGTHELRTNSQHNSSDLLSSAGFFLARNYVINDQTQTITLNGCNMKGPLPQKKGWLKCDVILVFFRLANLSACMNGGLWLPKVAIFIGFSSMWRWF